jgi:hypothetical protein
MTTNNHTAIPYGGALTAAAMEAPLSQLDAAISAVITTGSGASTTLTAQANSGQKNLVVADRTGWVVGDVFWIGVAGGTYESGVIASGTGAGAGTLVAVANLANTYAIGIAVSKSPVELVAARGTYGTLGGRISAISTRVYDVKEQYGAKGDGATNDTTAIDAAAAAMTGGGTLYLPPGTYVYTGAQLDLLSNVHMMGAGIGVSVLKITSNNTTTNRRVRVLSKTNVQISDMTIQETGVSARAGNYGLITLETSTRCLIESVEMIGSSGTGFMALANCQYFTVRGCIVRDGWADGIHVQRGSRNFAIANNLLTNNGDDDIALNSHGSAIYGHVRDGVVIGNRCGEQNATLNLGSGIVVLGAIGVVVANNIIRVPRAGGIALGAIDDGGGEIAIGGRIDVIGNEIYGPVSASAGYGISIGMVRDVLVADNVIVSPQLNGIIVNAPVIDVSIHSNQIRDVKAARGIQVEVTKTTAAGYIALWTDALLTDGESKAYVFAHNVSIRGNKIGKCEYGGIYAAGNATDSIEGLSITDNEIRNHNRINSGSERGIYVTYAKDFLIRDNIVRAPWAGSAATPVLLQNITDAMQDQAVLVAGTKTVNTARVQAGDTIHLTRVLAGGTLGHLSVGTIVAGTSFVINSSSGTDTSTVFWSIER